MLLILVEKRESTLGMNKCFRAKKFVRSALLDSSKELITITKSTTANISISNKENDTKYYCVDQNIPDGHNDSVVVANVARMMYNTYPKIATSVSLNTRVKLRVRVSIICSSVTDG